MTIEDGGDPSGSSNGPSPGNPVGRAGGMRQAVVRSNSLPSIVWLVPLVAAIVGIFLAYRAYSERGPTISITFERALGLEAGKTKVKYKEVDIGLVESVDLTEDLSQVVVTASLVKNSERYLTQNTRFWVVRAEVSAGQISGIGTVLSGAYIAIDPATEGRRTRRFEGLEKAPVVTSDESGTIFQLRAETLGSVDVGSPVYYRWLRVGQVAGYELDDDGNHVNVQIFVEAPHDQRVRSTTRFWNASGLDFSLGSDGLEIDSPSLITMLIGGVAFETPATFDVARDVAEDMVFELYPNHSASGQTRYSLKNRFIVFFEESVAGLAPGSPVEFRGIQIGEVEDVQLEVEQVSSQIRVPVVIEIEPERLGLTGLIGEEAGLGQMEELVAKGLRARLATSNLLTGRKAVDFEILPNAAPASIRFGESYPELPTARGGLDAITSRVAHIVERVDSIPIESIGKNLEEVLIGLRGAIDEMRSLAGSANEDIVPGIAASLGKLEKTLESADTLISPESPMARELEGLVVDLSEAARSIRLLAERLEQHPEELLRGKEEE